MAKNRSAAEAFSIAGTKSARPAAPEGQRSESASPTRAEEKAQLPMQGGNVQTTSSAKRQAPGVKTRALTVHIPVELMRKLRERAFQEERSMTNVAIEALERYFEE
jgi:hypothetical protein